MKFAFMQNPLTQIPFFAWIYNSFIISHLLEWLKVRQIKSGIRVNFDQCVLGFSFEVNKNGFYKDASLFNKSIQWLPIFLPLLLLETLLNCDVEQQNYYLKRDAT